MTPFTITGWKERWVKIGEKLKIRLAHPEVIVVPQYKAIVIQQYKAIVIQQYIAIVIQQYKAIVIQQYNAIEIQQYKAIVMKQYEDIVIQQYRSINLVRKHLSLADLKKNNKSFAISQLDFLAGKLCRNLSST